MRSVSVPLRSPRAVGPAPPARFPPVEDPAGKGSLPAAPSCRSRAAPTWCTRCQLREAQRDVMGNSCSVRCRSRGRPAAGAKTSSAVRAHQHGRG